MTNPLHDTLASHSALPESSPPSLILSSRWVMSLYSSCGPRSSRQVGFPPSDSRLTLKATLITAQSFARSRVGVGVGVGTFGAILWCTPDTHSRRCVTSQICNGTATDRRQRGGRSGRHGAAHAPRSATRRSARRRTSSRSLCGASLPCTLRCQHPAPTRSSNGMEGSALRDSRKTAWEGGEDSAHSGAGAWYVAVIVCDTKSAGLPWTMARNASPTDEQL